LLRAEDLGALNQLLELRQPKAFLDCICLVGPEEVSDPLGHF
jgi:hypothetical protein